MSVLSFLQHRSRQRAHKLYEHGRALIRKGSYDQALAIGRKLRKVSYSGAYEIEGLAYSHLDRAEDAVRVLREGLALAPGVWLNWSLLGSCLSDLGRYDEALAAYDRAAACEKANRHLIDLNRAVVAMRRLDYATALHLLDRIEEYDDEEMRLHVIGRRARSLKDIGREQEAEELALRTQEEWLATDDHGGKADVGELALILGEIRLARGEDRSALLADAFEWWRRTGHERLLHHARELLSLRSPDSQYFRLFLHGMIAPERRGEFVGEGFWTSADVVADSPQEATGFVAQLHGLGLGIEWRIDKAQALEPRPNGPKGVYTAGLLIFYRVEG